MSNLQLLDRAAEAAACQMLSAAGYGLVGSGAVTLWAGGTGFAPIAAGGVALLAANYLCPDMPLGGEEITDLIDGCQKVDGTGVLEVFFGGTWFRAFPPGDSNYSKGNSAVEILSVEVQFNSFNNRYQSVIQWTTPGSTGSSNVYFSNTEDGARQIKWRINPTNGTCVAQGGQPNPTPPEAFQPIEYVDNVTNCNYTVTLQGFGQRVSEGPIDPVWLIEGSSSETRNEGGRMGGCNFPPVIYSPNSGGGGGGDIIPVPPGGGGPDGPGGIPWWAGPLATAAAGAVLNQLLDGVSELIAPPALAGSFTLTAPCNKDEAGNPLQRTWEFEQSTAMERLNAHQVAILEVLQQHLDWKTPICDEQTIPEGDWRTISFRSDEVSPYGSARLRKRFRYLSVSGNDLSAVVDHWKDFTWEGGPYRVRWIGPTWRTPEVWAASEAEGQRVIQHAAREAGFDPLEGGEWRTRLSSSTRLGVLSNFRVDTTGGYYWITARDGSDGRPIVALT